MGAFRRFLFWDYARASWQYDVMVALILAFVFLTPRDFFRDQPKAASVAMLQPGTFWIEPREMAGTPSAELVAKASQLVKARYKIREPIDHVDPIYDDEQEIIGYTAVTKP